MIGSKRPIYMPDTDDGKGFFSRNKRPTWNASGWLSPKPSKMRTARSDEHYDDSYQDDSAPHWQQRRRRGASFDHTHDKKSRVSGWQDKADIKSSSVDSEESLNLMQSRSADGATSYESSGSERKNKDNSQVHSLLTTFLLSLNELLPEYVTHLSSAADLGSGGSSACKAVKVLERGANISLASQLHSDDQEKSNETVLPQCSPTYRSPRRATDPISAAVSAPSSPSYLATSPVTHFSPQGVQVIRDVQSHKVATNLTMTGSLRNNLQHWLSSSPRSSSPISSPTRKNPTSAPSSPQIGQYVAAKLTPIAFRRRSNPRSRMNSVEESEWERFVSPFLMLAGAEVLYGRMEHLVDPDSEKQHDKDDKKSGLRGSENESHLGDDFHQTGHDNKLLKPQRWLSPLSQSLATSFVSIVLEAIKEPFSPDNANDRGKTNFVKFASPHKSTLSNSSASDASGHVHGIENVSSNTSNTAVRQNFQRGSRRLIAMYHQIRNDIVIVGEYLCDPVLGAHSADARDKSPSKSINDRTQGKQIMEHVVTQKLPPPPMPVENPSTSPPSALSPSSSPEKMNIRTEESNRAVVECDFEARIKTIIKDSGIPSTNISPASFQPSTPKEIRELAAISLRHTLDDLIAFIDARCSLIRIQAELCCPPSSLAPVRPSFIPSEGATQRSWMELAHQCSALLDEVPDQAESGELLTKLLISRLTTETRALELALTTIHYLMECDYFNCVLSVRKLHVLLRRHQSATEDFLPLLWIRYSLAGILSIMRIFFARSDSKSAVMQVTTGKSSKANSSEVFGKSSRSSGEQKAELKSNNQSNVESDIHNFITAHKLGPPLAVAVVLKNSSGISNSRGGSSIRNDIISEGDGLHGNEESVAADFWTPLYIVTSSTSSDKLSTGSRDSESIFQPKGQEPNLVQMIRQNFSNDRENKDNIPLSSNGSVYNDEKSIWPMNSWNQIERCLKEHGETNHDDIVGNGPSKHFVYLEEDGKAKQTLSLSVTSEESVVPSPNDHALHSAPAISSSSPSIRAAVGNFSSFTSLAGAAGPLGMANSSNNVGNKSQSSMLNSSKAVSQCFISSITNKVSLIIIQDLHPSNKRKITDDSISMFSEALKRKLKPDNLLSTSSILDAKIKTTNTHESSGPNLPHSFPPLGTSRDSINSSTRAAPLWSETGWSDDKRKKILSTLGLRKHSPVMAPLKSPYVKRQIGASGRQRKKKMKSSINHGHLDFFLGPELSQLL